MAVKDWVQTRNNKYQKTWEKFDKQVVVLAYYEGKNKYLWSSSVFDDKTGNGLSLHGNKYLTKSQALKYAKSYMRKH